MPSVSKKQQKFFGIVRSIQKGDADASEFSKDARDAAKKMKKGDVKKFAKTKHKGLPTKVRQEIDQIVDSVIEEYTMARKNVIDKIATLTKANRYGSVDGTQMNGKTAKEIMAIYNHPKMKKFK